MKENKEDGILSDDQRSVLLQIADHHGASNVRVFGSRRHGRHGPDSDLDLLVDMQEGSSLLDLIALRLDLEDALGLQVDLVTEAGLSSFLRETILDEAIEL